MEGVERHEDDEADWKLITKLYKTMKKDMPTSDSKSEKGLKEFQVHYDKYFKNMRKTFFDSVENAFELASDSTLKDIL